MESQEKQNKISKQFWRESFEKIHQDYPMLEQFREHELTKQAHEILNNSTFGKYITFIYFFIFVGSIFVYWLVVDANIFLSIFLGIITWFVITFIGDRFLIKFLGIRKALKQDIRESFKKDGITDEQLKKHGF